MVLPVIQITKLLAQLTVLAPVASEGVDRIRKLVETVRRGDANVGRQIEALNQAVELQSAVNRKIDEQLRVIQSVLENVQKSLKICTYSIAAVGIIAVAALVIGLWILLAI